MTTPTEALIEEANAIHGRDAVRSGIEGKKLYQALNGLDSAALCLSGGGIRSASFSLGVIEALARHPLPSNGAPLTDATRCHLTRFNYLSTVSGGGYMGGFLSAWLMREHAHGGGGWPAVWAPLAGERETPDDEPPQLAWLRTYSNYLTPKVGLSADLWTAIAIYLRNLLLNWLLIIPVVCGVLLALKLFAVLLGWFGQFHPQEYWPPIACGIVGAVLLGAAISFSNKERPTHGESRADQRMVLLRSVLPAFLAAIAFTAGLAFPAAESVVRDWTINHAFIQPSGLGLAAVAGVVVFALSWAARWPRCLTPGDWWRDWALWTVVGAVYGVLVDVGIYLFFLFDIHGLWFGAPRELLLLIAGVPWFFLSQLIAEMIFVGLSSYEAGSDSDREWFGRAAGFFLAIGLAWLVTTVLVFLGAKLVGGLYSQLATWIVGGGAGTVTALLGKSRLTSAQPGKNTAGGHTNLILAFAAIIFAIALVVGLSALLDQIIFGVPVEESQAMRARVSIDVLPPWQAGIWLFGTGVLALVVGYIASRAVNINRFSLHALYRNRIIRAFLGASHKDRDKTRNPFTDFDELDNLRVHQLWPRSGAPTQAGPVTPANWRPFHVLNMALNIVSTTKLAWQERKAEPFFVTPLHCGSRCLPTVRSSEAYGDSRGISLGTAVAISGAAASPNMGYHSSPAVAFLLTLLNVRLGWWLGNPGPAGNQTFGKDAPPTAIKPLVYEMLGLTSDQSDFVYLSDGGHFENLGLYEMVRRRCRVILVVDAGCDKDFAFEDLGNAVRKVALDLGVTITFTTLDKLLFRADPAGTYPPNGPPFYAKGTIHYCDADGGGVDGVILYVKPAFHSGRLTNVGVRNYATAHGDFPHESTADQWFSESQLESYRALGCEMMESILIQGQGGLAANQPASLYNVIAALP